MIDRTRAPVVDIERAVRRVGGDRMLLAELVEIFLADLPARLAALRHAIETRNALEGARGAHTLKGSLAVLEAGAALALASDLETLCHEARFDAASSMRERLEAELGRVQAFFGVPDWQHHA